MTTIASVTSEFETWDGIKLFYRTWPAQGITKRSVLLFHGGHEHSGRFDELVEKLGRTNTTYYAWDARGHGRSPGERGYAESLHNITHDADCFVKFLIQNHELSLRDTVFLGHSVGSLVVLSYVSKYKPEIRGMVLGSPALHVKTYVPFERLVMRLFIKFKPRGHVNSYVVARMLTHDEDEIRARENDPLIARPIGNKLLLSILEEGSNLVGQAAHIRMPVLILSAGSDWVVHLSAQQEFFRHLRSDKKEMIVYPGFYHEVFHEKERAKPIQKAREFIDFLFKG